MGRTKCYFIFSFALSLLANRALANQACASVLRELAKFAYTSDYHRSHETLEFWKVFKENDKNLEWKPKRYDIGADCALELCPLLFPHHSLRQSTVIGPSGNVLVHLSEPVEYEEYVLMMRKGDVVVHNGVSFILKDFLGAGNASHVWSIEATDKIALKLPFLSAEAAANLSYHHGRQNFVEASRAYLRDFVNNRPSIPGVRVITISGHGPGFEYALVEKIPGAENGRDFIFRNQALIDRIDRGQVKWLSDGEKTIMAKYAALWAAVRQASVFNHLDLFLTGKNKGSFAHAARQFLYDSSTNEWVLADW